MKTCSAQDHAGSAEFDDLNLPDPSAGTKGERNAEGGMFRGGISYSRGSQPTDLAVHANGAKSSQGRRYNSRRSASWSDTTLEAAMQAVDVGESVRGASRCFSIPLPLSMTTSMVAAWGGREVGRVSYVNMRRISWLTVL
jgi:hypothetical protein